MPKLSRIPRVTEVEVRPPFGLRVRFDDGVVREVDLESEVWGPIFKPLKDPAAFAQARVDDEFGTVVWPNGADLDPLVLHGDFEPAERPAAKSV